MNLKPNTLVSHPARQHAHELAHALYQGGMLQKFITSIWYKPGKFPYSLLDSLPERARRGVERELKKRYIEGVPPRLVEQFPYFEILREGADRLLRGYKSDIGHYIGNRIHDRRVASRIPALKPDIVIGYEMASLRSFIEAKKAGAAAVLDLAQVHWRFIEDLRAQYPLYAATFDPEVIGRINALKERELREADFIITLSELVKQSLISRGFAGDKIYTANMGFDPRRFTPKSDYPESGAFQMLYVGAITLRKGVGLMLEAVKRLNLPDAELLLIGGMTRDGADLLRKYRGLCRYLPYATHEELSRRYRQADVFLFPSYLDSWGIVVLEAMASGIPVIVSANTGAKEAVRDGESGFIIPVEDASALADRISYFYDNRAEARRMGGNAASSAGSYTWGAYGARVREIILEIAALRAER